ncbi:MAG TPA: MFS transporter [Dongiaceae bacterium]|nr:MFS transporter [Dongiaceae bacterium]
MTEPAARPNERDDGAAGTLGHVRWTVCAMLFLATTINYIDRQVIALLKPTLQQTIGLTEINYGYIVDAFQIAYAAGLLLTGRLVDRLGTRIGYMLVMAVWSFSAMGHALASTALQFGVARFFLGLGESGNFPAAIKTVAEWFPQKERSLATGLFNSGANLGAIIGPIIVAWAVLHYGWHAAFLVTGVFSAAWIVVWFLNYRTPEKHPHLQAAERRYIHKDGAPTTAPGAAWKTLLRYRQTWGFSCAKFLTDPIWWFYLFWLPSYLSAKFAMTLGQMRVPLVIVYTVSTIGSVGGGWLPAPFRKLGFSPAQARLAAMLVCASLVLPVFFLNGVRSLGVAIAILSMAAGAHQGWSANLFTTASDMFPRSSVGAVVGIGGMAGSVGGALFAFFAGHILQITHSYAILFAIAASAYLIALAALYLIAQGLRRAELAG